MRFIDNDIRRSYFRFYELIPMIEGTDPHDRTLSLAGGKLVPGHNRFIDYALSRCKLPDMVLDGSTKQWSIVLGLDVIYTLYQFLQGNILTSDGERISDLQFYLADRFRNLELELLVINPGNKDKGDITSILNESYGNRDSKDPQ